MSRLPPDFDTKHYPSSAPRLVLCVADNGFTLSASIPNSLQVFTEECTLSENVDAVCSNNDKPIRLGICTNTLCVTALPAHISSHGKNGAPVAVEKDTILPLAGNHGYNGGSLDLYIEDLSSSIARGLYLDVRGGNGSAGQSTSALPNGGQGGNGGKAGSVSVCFGNVESSLAQSLSDLYGRFSDTSVSWGEVKETLSDLIAACKAQENFQKVPSLARLLKRLEDTVLNDDRMLANEPLQHVILAMSGEYEQFKTELAQRIQIDGGGYGAGGIGNQSNGSRGASGIDGNFSIVSMYELDNVIKGKQCLAHPVQCRMLLEKALLKYFVGGNDLQQSVDILMRLKKRLSFTEKLSETSPLWKAYRDTAASLFIFDSGHQEPTAITQLKNIKTIVDTTISQIVTEKDFYGYSYQFVPRGSYITYQAITLESINYLAEVEAIYSSYLGAQQKSEEKRQQVFDSVSQAKAMQAYNDRVIEDLILRLKSLEITINAWSARMKTANAELRDKFKVIEHKIRNEFKVTFDTLVSAAGQFIFAPHLSMLAVQGASVLNDGTNTVPRDDGSGNIKKEFLVKKFQKVENNATSINEGYRAVKHGSLDLLDPNATKLIMAEDQLDALLEDFADYIGDELAKDIMDAFNTFIDATNKRNSAVLDYNITISLWVKLEKENDHIRETAKTLSSSALQLDNIDYPEIVSFVEKVYVDSIHRNMKDLYMTQRAYQFITLDKKDIIATALQGAPFSQLNSKLLKQARQSILDSLHDAREAMSQPSVLVPFKYPLSKGAIAKLAGSKGKGANLFFTIDPVISSTTKEQSPFAGYYDIRLTKVRFFAPGAKTKDNRLEVRIIHEGTEKIVNELDDMFEFTHNHLKVPFRYNVTDNSTRGNNCVDGKIGDIANMEYALVGPFADWTIEIKEDLNIGLDLSGVSDVYLEFIGKAKGF